MRISLISVKWRPQRFYWSLGLFCECTPGSQASLLLLTSSCWACFSFSAYAYSVKKLGYSPMGCWGASVKVNIIGCQELLSRKIIYCLWYLMFIAVTVSAFFRTEAPVTLLWHRLTMWFTAPETLRNPRLHMIMHLHTGEMVRGEMENPVLYLWKWHLFRCVWGWSRLNEMRNIPSSAFCVVGGQAFCPCSNTAICQVPDWEPYRRARRTTAPS